MTYQDRIRKVKPKMSKSFIKLADYLLDFYIEASFMTATELAHELNLDAATVVRFSQFLGYPGFPQLSKEIRKYVKRGLLIHSDEPDSSASLRLVIHETMDSVKSAIDQTKTFLDIDTMERIIESIETAKQIFILASTNAQPFAYDLVYALKQGQFPVSIGRTGQHDIANTIYHTGEGDLLLAIDLENESRYIKDALILARQKGVQTAIIVTSPSLPATEAADYVLAARKSNTLELSIIAIQAITLALVHALQWRNPGRFQNTSQAVRDIIRTMQTDNL